MLSSGGSGKPKLLISFSREAENLFFLLTFSLCFFFFFLTKIGEINKICLFFMSMAPRVSLAMCPERPPSRS